MAKSDTTYKSPLALGLVDVINHFEFPDGDRVLGHALRIAPRIAQLKKRARAEGIPVIYVNDNLGTPHETEFYVRERRLLTAGFIMTNGIPESEEQKKLDGSVKGLLEQHGMVVERNPH